MFRRLFRCTDTAMRSVEFQVGPCGTLYLDTTVPIVRGNFERHL
jgi:hypothetical protein